MNTVGKVSHYETLVASLTEGDRKSYLKSQRREDMLPAKAHFDYLVERLGPAERKLYDSTKHVRIETAFRGRKFVIYEIADDNEVFEIDAISVLDFKADAESGCCAQIWSADQQRYQTISYAPTQLFDYPVIVCIPLHLTLRINWSTTPSNIEGGSLGFPLLIRTLSRRHLREKEVVYMETGSTFDKEFGPTNR